MEQLRMKVIPEGYKAVSFNSDTGEIVIEKNPTSIIDRINTMQDVFEELSESQQEYANLEFAPYEAHMRAFVYLKLICRCLNEGWEADLSDKNQDKYAPFFEILDGEFMYGHVSLAKSFAHIGIGIYFKSEKLAEHAAKQFLPLYESFIMNRR